MADESTVIYLDFNYNWYAPNPNPNSWGSITDVLLPNSRNLVTKVIASRRLDRL